MVAAILFFGILIGMAVINDKLGFKEGDLGPLVKEVFYPEKGNGFFLWVAAIVGIAALLRVLNLPEAGKALIVLIVLAYFLGNANIPGQILTELQGVKGAAAPATSTGK